MTGERRLSIPEPGVRELAHQMAYKIACEQLASVDIAAQCQKAGATYFRDENAFSLKYLNRLYRIALPGGEVSLAEGNEAVPLRDKILLLHYFIHASGRPLRGQLITYKELPEGINYYPTFLKRAAAPLASHFKDMPETMPELAARLGGYRAAYGDIAATIPALPRVPVTVVFWRGDEEFPAEANILFDSSISEYLPTEDITILSETIAWKLVRLKGTGGDRPGQR